MVDDLRVIGIDVGGTKIAGGIVDVGNGSVQARIETPTRAERHGDRVLDDVVEIASRLSVDLGHDPTSQRLGVAVCELVDPSGAITSAQTFDWRHLDVVGVLTAVGSATIASDVRAGAAAEGRFGAGRGSIRSCTCLSARGSAPR